MLNKSIIHISAVSAGNILNSGLGFLFIAALAKVFPLETFGKYVLLTSLLVSLAKIMDFGSNSIFVANSIIKDENILSKFISLKLVLFLITLPIALATLSFFRLLTPQTSLIFFLGLCAYGVNFTLFALFQRIEKFNYALLINTFPALIKASFAAAILLRLIEPSFESALWVFSISMFSCFVFIFYVPSEFKKFRVSLQNSKTMLVETAPAGINLLVNDGWSTISNTIAKIYGSFSDVGIFSLADKISSIFSLISLSIFTVILPKNAKRKKHNLTYDFKETLIISIGILGLALAAIVASQIFITKFFGNKFIGSLYVLDLLVFSSAITAIYSFVRDYFFIEQQTEKLLKVTLIRLSTFLLVSLILVPSMSIRGLALSNLIASLVTFLFTIFLISRLSRSSSVVA